MSMHSYTIMYVYRDSAWQSSTLQYLQVGFPPITPECLWDTNRFARYKDVDAGPLGKRVLKPSARSEYCSVFREDGEGVSGEGVRGAGVSLLGMDSRKTARNTITGKSQMIMGALANKSRIIVE